MADVRRLPGPGEQEWRWQQDGACHGLRTSMFFHPENERGPSRAHREAEAKAVCRRCPVLEQCRDHSLQVREPYGIWGGLSAEERTAEIRRRRRGAVAADL